MYKIGSFRGYDVFGGTLDSGWQDDGDNIYVYEGALYLNNIPFAMVTSSGRVTAFNEEKFDFAKRRSFIAAPVQEVAVENKLDKEPEVKRTEPITAEIDWAAKIDAEIANLKSNWEKMINKNPAL